MILLNRLITAAMELAGEENHFNFGNRLWHMEGGRTCPIGWNRCSQPVYVDLKTGEYDYGDEGGPGHADCVANCPHGMNKPEWEGEEG